MPLFSNEKYRILLIHIPKTGGTSIEKYLSEQFKMSFFSPIPPVSMKICPQHLQITDLRILLGNNWDYSFAFVRNPYTRIESEYFYRTQHLKREPDFSTWVIKNLQVTKSNPFYLDNHMRPQTDFIDSDVSLFKFESGFDKVIEHLHEKFHIDISNKFPKENVSLNRREVTWSLEALNLVNDFYANDFSQLGYEKRTKKLNLK